MKSWSVILLLALAAAGCTTSKTAQLRAQDAYFAGQNAALLQSAAKFNGVTIIGMVQNPQVDWVEGMTLAQAIAAANFIGHADPRHIIITHQGEKAVLDANVLFNGADIPVEPGDIVELRP